LQGKTVLQPKTKLKKVPKKHTIAWYKKEARKWFNRAIKYRDSEFIEGEWLFQCITCDRRVLFVDREGRSYQNAHAGHFMPETRSNTRFNELNVNAQCFFCNRNQGEQYAYAKALDLKYGQGTAEQLVRESKIDHQYTIPELEQIIRDNKEIVRWYEKTPDLSQPLGN
jgi:hypothetical protein